MFGWRSLAFVTMCLAWAGCPDDLGERPTPPAVQPVFDGGDVRRDAGTIVAQTDAGMAMPEVDAGVVQSDIDGGVPAVLADAGTLLLDAGVVISDAGNSVVDEDGCADNPCGEPATCVDQPPGAETEYHCDCYTGYEPVPDGGVGCQYIDECALGTDECEEHSYCSNITGHFSCVCSPGYIEQGDGCVGVGCLGDGDCDDEDPCTSNACGFTPDGGVGTCVFQFADADLDGVCDGEDNCVEASNPNQEDTDDDDIGNFCDVDDDDLDDDGFDDSDDNCMAAFNPSQADTDGDGVGDACNDADDQDGDEYASVFDCNDNDPESTVRDTDADCDGVLFGMGMGCDNDSVATVVSGFASDSYNDSRGVDKVYDSDDTTSWRTTDDFQHVRLDLEQAGMITALSVTADDNYHPASFTLWLCPTAAFSDTTCTLLASPYYNGWGGPQRVDFPPIHGQHVWLRDIEKTHDLYLELSEVQVLVLACDNCPDVENPNQIDTDDDGEGNLCDVDDDDTDNDETPDDADCLVGDEHSATSTVIAEDGDCDSLLNDIDKCPEQNHHNNDDLDDDGLGDVCDPDRDGDGVDNDLECAPDDGDSAPLIEYDGDCDEILNGNDCLVDGVHSVESTVVAEDADCDDVLTADDCDDSLASLDLDITKDPDCDGVININDGTDWRGHVLPTWPRSGGYTVYAEDMNGDGQMDFLTSEGYWEHVGGPMYAPKGSFQGNNTVVLPVDFDGEGYWEVLVTGVASSSLKLFAFDEAQNTYQQNLVLTTIDDIRGASAGDIDGDGDIDLVAGSFGGSAVVWLENDGEQNFTEHLLTTECERAYHMEVADIDNDSDADVVFACNSTHQVFWLENDGDTTGAGTADAFIAHPLESSANGLKYLSVGDVNGDALLDILVSGNNVYKLTYFQNNGQGVFEQKNTASSAKDRAGVRWADLNNDGHMDMVAATGNPDQVAWWRNDGAGSFNELLISTGVLEPYGLHVADMDGDTDTDVLVMSHGDQRALWYENLNIDNCPGVANPDQADSDGDGIGDYCDDDMDNDNDGYIGAEDCDDFDTNLLSSVLDPDCDGKGYFVDGCEAQMAEIVSGTASAEATPIANAFDDDLATAWEISADEVWVAHASFSLGNDAKHVTEVKIKSVGSADAGASFPQILQLWFCADADFSEEECSLMADLEPSQWDADYESISFTPGQARVVWLRNLYREEGAIQIFDIQITTLEDCDNCPEVANPDQADMDEDGIGDVCDDDIDGDGATSDLDCDDSDASFVSVAMDPDCDGIIGVSPEDCEIVEVPISSGYASNYFSYQDVDHVIENAFDEGADYTSTAWVAEASEHAVALVRFDLPYAQPVTRLELRNSGNYKIDSFDVWVCAGFEFNEVDCIEVASDQQADSGVGTYEIISFGEAVYGNSVWLNDFVKHSNMMSVGIVDVRIFASTCYDNCPDQPNADQADTDGDGVGDACDLCVVEGTTCVDGNASCLDTGQTAACTCHFGYVGDGVTCALADCPLNADGAPSCMCVEGYNGVLGWDIDAQAWTGTCAE